MAIEIKEYIGDDFFNEINSDTNNIINIKEYDDEINPVSEDAIIQEIEGIHVGPTRNFTWYMESALDSSIDSWTKPYQKPLIMHHNEKDGTIIGRIISVRKETKNTRSNTPALVFSCNVPDKDGKEQILDGRLKTVSIGITCKDLRCSICGNQVELDENGIPICEHERGNVYNDKVCYWEVHQMEAKELSYVIVPSDIYTHNLKTYKINSKAESNVNLCENLNLNLKEGKIKEMTIEKSNIEKEPSTEDIATITEKEHDVEAKEVENKEVEEKATENKTEIEELKAEIEKLKAEKESIKKDAEKAKEDLNIIVDKLNSVQTSLQQEIILKESLESKLINSKKELREAMEDNLNSLRTALNKPVVLKENLNSRSIESIKDSISDLKSELSGFNSVKNIVESVDPTLKTIEKTKNNSEIVKESKKTSNIDMTEEEVKNTVQNILSSLLL